MNIQKLHMAIAAVAPIDGVSADGTITYQTVATEAEKTAAQAIMDAFLVSPETWLAAHKGSDEARAEGETYVHHFFSDMQLMRLQQLLLSPATSQTQLEKIQAILTWLDQIEAAWLSSPATFKASNYGEPPHTYADILSA